MKLRNLVVSGILVGSLLFTGCQSTQDASNSSPNYQKTNYDSINDFTFDKCVYCGETQHFESEEELNIYIEDIQFVIDTEEYGDSYEEYLDNWKNTPHLKSSNGKEPKPYTVEEYEKARKSTIEPLEVMIETLEGTGCKACADANRLNSSTILLAQEYHSVVEISSDYVEHMSHCTYPHNEINEYLPEQPTSKYDNACRNCGNPNIEVDSTNGYWCQECDYIN